MVRAPELRFGWTEHVATTGPSDEGLGHRNPPGVKIEAADPETGDLGPAQAEDCTEPQHRPVLLRHVAGDRGDVLWGQIETPGSVDRWEVDVAARVPSQPVVAYGVAEHGPHHLVVALDRPGSVRRPPCIHQSLDVPGPDPLDAELADRRQYMQPERQLLSGGGGLPLGRIGGSPFLGEFPHPESSGPGVDPHAPTDVGLDAGEKGPGVALGLETRRCDMPAAVVPVAGFIQAPSLTHAPKAAGGRHGHLTSVDNHSPAWLFSRSSCHCLRAALMAAVAGTTTSTRWSSTQCSTSCASNRTKRPTFTMGAELHADLRLSGQRSAGKEARGTLSPGPG